MNKQYQSILTNNSNNLAQYYEYRVYDRNIGDQREMRSSMSEYGPCPIVVMSRHQGFQWNEELFVSAYRRSAGYECHKSPLLEDRDKKISSTTNQTCLQDNSTSPEVIEIKLTEADRDVWP
ncbi:hypothetical protein EDC94DRAFT_624529 [Helicostylum pulchrum]|uniref:Uncharacterized protein n=1 Tax=Helicostylum pulchrum TaxID=562976 RepID=A0ABP9YIF9_9FUNG|nr:hypothetical protein EDC94DRAFT_624529 [Helicostylum pulchrum]